jgi:hypothetical protein
MPAANSDRNLLFGVLALQMDFLGRDALIAAMHAWVLDKARPLGQILDEQQALRPDQRDLLDALVQKHLGRHSRTVPPPPWTSAGIKGSSANQPSSATPAASARPLPRRRGCPGARSATTPTP